MSETATQKPAPVRVAVTGAAGQIGYSLVFRIASGQLLGPEVPIILQMLEIPLRPWGPSRAWPWSWTTAPSACWPAWN